MKRLLVTLWTDLRLQWRNGFYAVSAFVLAFWAVVASQVPREGVGWLLPGMIAGNLLINTFFYVAGLVLLEKGEGTLAAQAVTPLRRSEWLGARLISLLALSLLENGILALLWAGFTFGLLPLALGILLASALFVLAGFLAVTRYESINEFLLPSMLYTLLLLLPLLDAFRVLPSPLFYLHPLQASLVWLKAAFTPAPAWELAYGLLYSLAWIAGGIYLGQRALKRVI